MQRANRTTLSPTRRTADYTLAGLFTPSSILIIINFLFLSITFLFSIVASFKLTNVEHTVYTLDVIERYSPIR